MEIKMSKINGEEKLCVVAYNQGGYDATAVPLEDIVEKVNESGYPFNLKMEITGDDG